MHEPKKRRKYDAAFKSEVLKMVANGQSVSYITGALGILENLIYSWKKKGGKGKQGSDQPADLSLENHQLRDRIRQLETERDILKKALGIFSRST